MGTRARARSGAAASRCQSAGNAPASREGRASLRDAEDADGRDPLPDETCLRWPCSRLGRLPSELRSPSAYAPWVAAFVQRLRDLGWVEGRTVAARRTT